ncbi:cyclic nucleotide-gated ion channel 1 [Morus notabilis]|uniref:cyclic nucleotide-gated ion channel 1 n=1 Tax=Morus notabilis TaxID=981085 RepID=UPI000CECECC9|nr:cyclic nucleotide-gated ion channel 1 [Morus notabilis]
MYRREREVVPLAGGITSQELEIQVVRNPKISTADERQHSKRDDELAQRNITRTKLSIMKEILDLRGAYLQTLNKIFLTSWVIAVITDPFFLYIPTLNEEKKCLRMDKNLEIVALVLRSITDLSYILHIVFQLLVGFLPRNSGEWEENGFLKYALARARRFKWSYILIDVLAVLPVPQVVILVYFSEIRQGLRPSSARKLLCYIILLFQYAPRVLQIYLACEALKKTRDAFSEIIWVRGAFNLFLYIIASHILGAFWYFFSIEQEMACWQNACKNQIGCLPSVFNSCNDNTPRNLTFVNDFCPMNPPNSTVFDFGIFLGAIQSGIITSSDFPSKLLQCFWWGLRNLSSFGSNLEASSTAWETCFAALISMLGLLIFLYLIGNLQLYMQLSTQRSEDRRHKRKDEIQKIVKAREPDIDLWASIHKLREPEEVKTAIMAYMQEFLEHEKYLNFKKLQKKLYPYFLQAEHQPKLENGHGHLSTQKENDDHCAMCDLQIIYLKLKDIISGETKHLWNKTEETAELWMLKNGIPKHIIPMIKKCVRHRLQNNNDDVDMVNLFSILPIELQRTIKQRLCLNILKRVPELQNVDEEVHGEIIKHLKPVIYAENSYIIREGEPISHMLFVTQGLVWVFGNGSIMKIVAKGDYYGEQLLEWQLSSASYTEVPISTKNVQSHTNVEALTLKAVDLKLILTKYWWKFPIAKQYKAELLKRFAVSAIGEAWLRCRRRRQKLPSHKWPIVNRKIRGVTAWMPS